MAAYENVREGDRMYGDTETIASEWEQVYVEFWDSGAPGPGAGVEYIYKLNGIYAAILSSEDDPLGPFNSLIDTLKGSELDLVLSGVTDIECSEMIADELAAVLHSPNDPGFRLSINREDWELDQATNFVRVVK